MSAAIEARLPRSRECAALGYGLKLVERVARAWGAREGTTHVWAEVELS